MTPAPLALDAAMLDAAAALIAALDLIDGDPDSEADGDEVDGSTAEDDYGATTGDGPGCAVADIDCCPAAEDRLFWWFGDEAVLGCDDMEASRQSPEWPDTWADHSPPQRRLDDERTT